MALSGTFTVVLTGGIASGKTTVADQFGELGAVLIDTDVIARQVVEPGTEGLTEIAATFGKDVLQEDGSLDRRALRAVVFADDAKRRELEAIVHPRIRDETMRQMLEFGGPYQIIVVPLLAESPLQHAVDRILVVDCAEEVQLARLLARDNENEAQARRIIAAQTPREERLAIADDVIENDRDLDYTRQQVATLHQKYMELAAQD